MFYVESITIDNRTWFQKVWNGFQNWCEMVGYSRAASRLAAMGYYEEAKECMLQYKKLKK